MATAKDLSTAASSPSLAAANAGRVQRQKVRGLVHSLGFSFTGKRRGSCAVLAHSRLAGEAELRGWRHHNVFPRVEKETRLQQIFAWADEHKVKGKPWGLLSPKQKIILEVLHDARDYRTGRLDYAFSQICAMARCTTQTLNDAIKKFESLHLIEKWRRMVPLLDAETGGARNTQINNAYFLKLPGEVAKRVRAALEKLGEIILPPVQPPREPTEHEVTAAAGSRAKAARTDGSASARHEHYANSAAQDMIARGNAPLTS
ncbi:hypothetical protein [Sphingomonas sp. PAMC 26605]|uniref:hypothetical protein n=1 Tax=Sphingomonas sp. PAMC 26605 TaxID=1112214 RepID=UPI0012F49532|nr:hypothetical protein [Sphingomonas sp. PAMC 26605]